MNLRTKTLLTFLCFSFLLISANAKTSRTHVFYHENILGTSLAIKVVATSPAEAQKAEAAVLTEITRNAKLLSTYDPNSEVSQ